MSKYLTSPFGFLITLMCFTAISCAEGRMVESSNKRSAHSSGFKNNKMVDQALKNENKLDFALYTGHLCNVKESSVYFEFFTADVGGIGPLEFGAGGAQGVGNFQTCSKMCLKWFTNIHETITDYIWRGRVRGEPGGHATCYINGAKTAGNVARELDFEVIPVQE